MREQRSQRIGAHAPVHKADSHRPEIGYALVVDGQAKSDFKTHAQAVKAATDLKGRFPMLRIEVYDAEGRTSEKIELSAAA